MSRPRGRPTLLSRELIATICKALREGAFFAVACEAAGVSRRVGHLWLQRGEAAEQADFFQEGDELYLHFLHEVRQARAKARQVAENRVFKEHPEVWLKSGPGRHEDEDNPGWTQAPRAVPAPQISPAERALIEALVRLGGQQPGSLPVAEPRLPVFGLEPEPLDPAVAPFALRQRVEGEGEDGEGV